MFQIIPNFYPPLADKVRNGIFTSLRQILEKRVLATLYPLFDSPKLDRELRSKIRDTFKEFCLPPNADPGKMHKVKGEYRYSFFSFFTQHDTIFFFIAQILLTNNWFLHKILSTR